MGQKPQFQASERLKNGQLIPAPSPLLFGNDEVGSEIPCFLMKQA